MYEFIRKASSRLARDDGGVTVEFVVLFPALLSLMAVTMDIGFTYYKKSQIHAAIQDVTRARSIGAIASDGEAADILTARLAQGFTDEAVVDVKLVEGAIVSTSVDVPLHDMQLVGFFARLVGDPTVVIGDQQFLENFDVAVIDDGGPGGGDTVMVEGILEAGLPGAGGLY